MSTREFQAVFIHGRPGPHPSHAALARSIHARFVPIDFLMRWHDSSSGRLRRIISWVLCAVFFPNRKLYDVFISEGIHFSPSFMKRMGLIRKRQRLAAMMGGETLYFLHQGQYGPRTTRALLKAMQTYDAIICMGRMERRLVEELVQQFDTKPQIYTSYEVLPSAQAQALNGIRPALESKNVVCIANGPNQWRAWYKGIDLLLESFQKALSFDPGCHLRIAGEWDSEYQTSLMNSFEDCKNSVSFLGRVNGLQNVLSESALCVHLGRGDSFPVSILEAMTAGVPVLVSEWTGSEELLEKVDKRLVIPLDSEIAALRIRWYFELPPGQRQQLSDRCREVAAQYSEQMAVSVFQDAVRSLMS